MSLSSLHSRNQKMKIKRHECLPLLFPAGLFLLAFFSACVGTRSLSEQNLAPYYQISDPAPLVHYQLYQYATDSLRVYCTLPAGNRHQAGNTQSDSVKFHVFAMITPAKEPGVITDSVTHYLTDAMMERAAGFTFEFSMLTGDPAGKILSIRFDDSQNKASTFQQEQLIPFHPPGRYHFLLLDEFEKPHSGYLTTGEKFILRSEIAGSQAVRVRYYAGDYPVPLPPYATYTGPPLSFAADSIFYITFRDGATQLLEFDQAGIYHFTADTNSQEGFTLFVRPGSFPWITQSSQMIPPLIYLTTSKEFQLISAGNDPKVSVDSFWLELAGNESRARKLIRDYYRRVEKANYLFTSYQDGWKTDRGMIYILYGPPSIVRRYESSEIWIYGESSHLLSLNFVFAKMHNPFSGNDYRLERNPNYKSGWNQMVNSWRR